MSAVHPICAQDGIFKMSSVSPVASFTKEFNPRLAKRPLKTNGRLANRGLTSLVKEATGSLVKHISVSELGNHLLS